MYFFFLARKKTYAKRKKEKENYIKERNLLLNKIQINCFKEELFTFQDFKRIF